jgi:GNAT superfamily N-acetyltransferase
MADLLVNLLNLQPFDSTAEEGFILRRAQPFEITPVHRFVETNFSRGWADEISVGFTRQPISVFVATVDRKLVGFAAYECTRRAFFGPTGVIPAAQGQGIGKALLLASLWALREMGYVYAIIGAAGPVHFYQKTVGAIVIPGSDPGIYTDLLKNTDS